MKNSFLKLITVSSIALVTGCSSSQPAQQPSAKQVNLNDIPQWYNENPSNNDYFFATSTERSEDLQTATNKAAAGARAEIARMAENHVNTQQKKFTEEVGSTNDSKLEQLFAETSTIIASQSLVGSTIDKKYITREGNGFRSYVLVKYPVGKVNAELLTKLKSQEYANTRLRATKSFDELEQNVEKYEASKKLQ